MKKNPIITFIVSLVLVFSLFGCVEHRYYHNNHRHSDEYMHRHHHEERHDAEIDIHH